MSEPLDRTVAGTAEENIPTQSNPMDNIHGTTEDISNKASGYKAAANNPNFKPSTQKAAKEKLEALGGDQAFMYENKKGE